MARKLIKQPLTKSQLMSEIAEQTGLARKDVGMVFDELRDIIGRHIASRAAGEFTLPGLLKVKRVKVPARKARKNVPNPFRPGETMDIPARPASSKVRVTPLKGLKDMI